MVTGWAVLICNSSTITFLYREMVNVEFSRICNIYYIFFRYSPTIVMGIV